MRRLAYPVLVLLLLWPIETTMLSVSGKPVDFVLSDLTIPIGLIAFFRSLMSGPVAGSSLNQLGRVGVVTSLVFILFAFTSALLGFMESGRTVVLFSFAKFIKPFVVFLASVAMAQRMRDRWQFERVLVVGVAALVAGLFVSTLIWSKATGRWGGNFLGREVYGFPNSAMSYLAFLLPLLLAGAQGARTSISKVSLMFGVATGGLIVVLSLSRSSLVVAGLSMLIFLSPFLRPKPSRRRWIATIGTVLGAGILPVLLSLQADWSEGGLAYRLAQNVGMRATATLASDDSLSGRKAIWQDTFEEIAEHPILGSGFVPYSFVHEGTDTTHQQYMEVFYKTGAVGGVLYFAFLIISMILLWRQARDGEEGDGHALFWRAVASGYVGLLVGNLTQPNFNYSLTGNALFLLLAVSSTMQPSGRAEVARQSQRMAMNGTRQR